MSVVAGLVVAVLASSASDATPGRTVYSEPVEVVDEGTGEHCAKNLENCKVHVRGWEKLLLPDMTTVVSVCGYEFDAVFDEDGSGHLVNIAATGPFCFSLPCPEPSAESEWPLAPIVELSESEMASELRLCLIGGSGGEFHCDVPLHIQEDPEDPHRYVFTTTQGPSGGAHGEFQCPFGVWVKAEWETESPHGELAEIEVEHDLE